MRGNKTTCKKSFYLLRNRFSVNWAINYLAVQILHYLNFYYLNSYYVLFESLMLGYYWWNIFHDKNYSTIYYSYHLQYIVNVLCLFVTLLTLLQLFISYITSNTIIVFYHHVKYLNDICMLKCYRSTFFIWCNQHILINAITTLM